MGANRKSSERRSEQRRENHMSQSIPDGTSTNVSTRCLDANRKASVQKHCRNKLRKGMTLWVRWGTTSDKNPTMQSRRLNNMLVNFHMKDEGG
jgi:hypothetical protein